MKPLISLGCSLVASSRPYYVVRVYKGFGLKELNSQLLYPRPKGRGFRKKVKVSALNNQIVYEFIKWLRDDFGYDGEIWIDVGASGSIYFSTSDLEYDIAIYNASKNTKFRTLLNQFIRVIKPSEVIGSEDFINCMEKKGWEYVEIIDKEEVFFYEWGGFIQGDDGKWYNNVWNEGYKEI